MAPTFAQLRAALKAGDMLVPGDEGYEASLERWSATCVKRAAVVVRPTSDEETSAAVRFAREHKMAFVVCGGGHNPSGASASEGGMVIHLSRMRSVSVDSEALTVTYGGGCLWSDVDDALWEHGLATVGGTVSHTGVGGLALGGGFGVLSGERGLCVDNMLSCRAVLADGTILTASEAENADLFWALRGAGHSFAVVTSFTSRCFPQGDIWGGVIIWPIAKIPEVVAFVNKFPSRTDGHQHVLVMLASHPVTFEPVVGVTLFHNGDAASAEEIYAPLLRIEDVIMNTCAVSPYPVANTYALPKVPVGRRYAFNGASFTVPMAVETMQTASNMFHAALAREDGAGGEFRSGSMLAFELISGQMTTSVPEGKMAFAGRTADAFNVFCVTSWDTPTKDEAAKGISAGVLAYLRGQGWKGDDAGDRGGTYYNYLNPTTEEERQFLRAERVFGPNVGRLRELKRKYDPENAFKQKVDLLASGFDKLPNDH